MVDGLKFKTKTSEYFHVQNADYNHWTHEHNRNAILVWIPFGLIVHALFNFLGAFYDSKLAAWGEFYTHVSKLREGFKFVCDDEFNMGGELTDKLLKTKGNFTDGFERSSYNMSLTHLC